MQDQSEVADYADMRRTMDRLNPVDVLEGQTCPDPGCDGTVSRRDAGAVCGDCERWLLRFF